MQDLAFNSGALGKKACFYLIDISNYLKQNSQIANQGAKYSSLPDPEGLSDSSQMDKTIMFIGGWSKSAYLPEVDCFYPKQHKLEKSWNEWQN